MTVKPAYFVQSMRARWAQEYGLKSNPSLEQAWHEMAVTFNDHIQGKVAHEWSILRLPTGSGKTQGLGLYCSLLSEQEKHPGILIITKFTKEIDGLITTINQSPYPVTACAEHGDLEVRPTLEDMHSSPILAITHSMYKRTLELASKDNSAEEQWGRFTEWKDGSRKLIVIDETLDVIQPVQVSQDLLRIVRGWIPRSMEIEKPERIQTLDKIITRFQGWEEAHPKEYDKEKVSPDIWKDISQEDISALFDSLCRLPLSRMITGRNDKGQMVRRCKQICSDILYMLSNHSWYERKTGVGSLNSAYVVLPTHMNSAVIMDATARQNRAYDLLGSIPNFRPMPDDIRSYTNVKLHVLYGYQNSKYHLMKKEQGEQHFVDVLKAFNPVLPNSAKFLFVSSKEVTKKLTKVKAIYRGCKVAHWGSINGKNEWSDCEAIIIYGLPRLDEITPQSSIIAFENWHEKSGKRYAAPSTIYEKMPDGIDVGHIQDNFVEEEDYHHGHVAADIIQAINRVRCRQVTDDHGGCAETNIYLMFNSGDELEMAILEAIKMEMPNIQITTSHAPSVQRKKIRSKIGQEIISRLAALPRGEYSVLALVNDIHAEVGIGSIASRKHFTGKCKDKFSPESQALAELGYKYVVDAKGGRGNVGNFQPI